MANWISSKLKKAETFLQQIDQQAAESLGKGEKPQLLDLNHKTSTKTVESAVTPLKDQFKKRNTLESSNLYKDSVITPPKPSSALISPISSVRLRDSDWTQLLNNSDKKSTTLYTNGVSRVHGLRKDPKKVVEVKKNSQKSQGVRKVNVVLESRVNSSGTLAATGENRKSSDGDESGSGDSVKVISNVELESSNGHVDSGEKEKDVSVSPNLETTPVSFNVGGIHEMKKPEAAIRSDIIPPRDSVVGTSLSSDGTSGSESDSSSGSDSEKERERKEERARRKELIVAEKAAARAVEVINEHENIVARLEGEKQSLEKILEERAKQQAQEASELQMSMMETMDAVDLEKQKHNNTRMKAFARLTKLETANADLAKSLAATQWNLEIESNQVADLRQQIELKDAIQEDLRRRITTIHQNGSSSNELEASRGVEFEREILEAEYSLTCDTIGQLQEKVNKLKENIEILQKEIEVPTDVEVELKRRLAQLTNHLIQKQSQVEALSSEKATLLFRIETVSSLLEEQKSAPQSSELAGPSLSEDLEAGTWKASKVKLRPMFAKNIQSGGQHLGSLIVQLDAIFSAGAAFIKRNSSARYMALFYLVCLHFWVSYIFMSHSQPSDSRSGAVISLENINKTTGP